jgi:hypothetical protein
MPVGAFQFNIVLGFLVACLSKTSSAWRTWAPTSGAGSSAWRRDRKPMLLAFATSSTAWDAGRC